MYGVHFICSSVDGHLGCIHFSATLSNAGVHMGVQVSESLLSLVLGTADSGEAPSWFSTLVLFSPLPLYPEATNHFHEIV